MAPLTELLPALIRCRDAWDNMQPADRGRDKKYSHFVEWVLSQRDRENSNENVSSPVTELLSLVYRPNDHRSYTSEAVGKKLRTNSNARLYRLVVAADVQCGESDFRVRELLLFIIEKNYYFRYYILFCGFFTFREHIEANFTSVTPMAFRTSTATRFQQLLFLRSCVELWSCLPSGSRKRRRMTHHAHVDTGDTIPGLETLTPAIAQRVGKVIQVIVEGWDAIARHLGFSDVESLVLPYVLLKAPNLQFIVLGRRRDGLAPVFASKHWKESMTPCTSSEGVCPLAFARVAEVDDKLRALSQEFFNDVYHMIHSPTLYSMSTSTRWASLARFKLDGATLPSRFRTLPIASLDLVKEYMEKNEPISHSLHPSKSANAGQTPPSPSVVQRGAPTNTTMVSTVPEYVPPSDKDVARCMDVLRNAIKPYVRMYGCAFSELEEAEELLGTETDVCDKVQLVLTDPPYNTRRDRGSPNSSHDLLNDEDMDLVVSTVSKLLRKGGHAIIFCTVQQFVVWEEKFGAHRSADEVEGVERPTFTVDAVPIIFAKNPNVYSGHPGKASCSLRNAAEFALHAKKNGLSYGDEATMVNYRPFNHVPSSYPAFRNIMNNVRGLLPGEQLRVSRGEGEGRYALRPEQKPLALMKELIARYSQAGDYVVDMFGGTFATAAACFDLREHRKFVGCEKDQGCHKHAEQHVIRRAAEVIAEGRTDIQLRVEAKEAAQLVYRKFCATPIQDRRWTAPPSLPQYQCVPPWVLTHLASCWSLPQISVTLAGIPVHQWPREYQGLLQQVDIRSVRLLDATCSNLVIAKSTIRHPGAGLGVFAAVSLSPGEAVCFYYGTLVYHNLWNQKASKKTYGAGVLGCTRDKFKKYALQLVTSGSAFQDVRELMDGQKAVSIVPAPFCVSGFINDPRYDPDDEDYEKYEDGTLEKKRAANVAFMQSVRPIRHVSHLVPHDAMSVRAISHINAGDELFVDYGTEHVFQYS